MSLSDEEILVPGDPVVAVGGSEELLVGGEAPAFAGDPARRHRFGRPRPALEEGRCWVWLVEGEGLCRRRPRPLAHGQPRPAEPDEVHTVRALAHVRWLFRPNDAAARASFASVEPARADAQDCVSAVGFVEYRCVRLERLSTPIVLPRRVDETNAMATVLAAVPPDGWLLPFDGALADFFDGYQGCACGGTYVRDAIG